MNDQPLALIPLQLPWQPDLAAEPLDDGWQYEAPPVQPVTGMWLPPIPRKRSGLIAASSGKWLSPPLMTEPFHYYRLSFEATVENRGYVAIKHQAADGRPLVSDHYAAVGPASEWAKTEFCFRAPPHAAATCISWEPSEGGAMRVRRMAVEEVDAAAVAATIHRIWKRLAPCSCEPPDERWLAMPRLRQRLTAGERVRIVVLGDSIANDLSNSLFETVVAPHFPGARLEVVTSVAGSTGCPRYQEPAMLREHVLQYEPDLLIIGGISNGMDMTPMRRVIEQVRAHGPTEFVLMSEAFGWVDHRYMPGWRRWQTPPNSYRDTLRRLALEEHLAFFDVAGCIGVYCDDASISDWSLFKRDRLHAGQLGRMLAARFFERFFSP